LAFDLVAFIINLIISTIILAPVLWLAGRALVGKKKAKFTDAIMIVVIGIVVGAIFGAFVPNGGIIGSIVQLIIWLYLVKHFFECGWLKALVISIVAIIIFVIIATVLGLFGYALMRYV
jgi:uncharacterized membrane protein YdbT with pleckstrin-like domain